MFKSRGILQMRSSLTGCRLCSFIAGTKKNEATDKMHRVKSNNLFLCFVEHVYTYVKNVSYSTCRP
jgi:hypothetical protein